MLKYEIRCTVYIQVDKDTDQTGLKKLRVPNYTLYYYNEYVLGLGKAWERPGALKNVGVSPHKFRNCFVYQSIKTNGHKVQLCSPQLLHKNTWTQKGEDQRGQTFFSLCPGTCHSCAPKELSRELAVKNSKPQGCYLQNHKISLIVNRSIPPFPHE